MFQNAKVDISFIWGTQKWRMLVWNTQRNVRVCISTYLETDYKTHETPRLLQRYNRKEGWKLKRGFCEAGFWCLESHIPCPQKKDQVVLSPLVSAQGEGGMVGWIFIPSWEIYWARDFGKSEEVAALRLDYDPSACPGKGFWADVSRMNLMSFEPLWNLYIQWTTRKQEIRR